MAITCNPARPRQLTPLMHPDLTRLEAQLNQVRDEFRSLKTDLEKVKAAITQLTTDAADAQRALGTSSAATKFAWIAPLLRRIENLERRTGTGPL